MNAQLVRAGLIVLLIVIIGIALLYAYRTQSPSSQFVSYDRAITEVQAGQVRQVTIVNDTATLDLRDGSMQMANIGTNDGGAFQKAILDYNATQPADKKVALGIQHDSQAIGVIGSIVISLLPVFLVGGFMVYLTWLARRHH